MIQFTLERQNKGQAEALESDMTIAEANQWQSTYSA